MLSFCTRALNISFSLSPLPAIDPKFLAQCLAVAEASPSPLSPPWTVSSNPSAKSDTTKPSPLQSATARIAPYTYQQARGYYYGLPSRPTFVASTINEIWAQSAGPEAYTPTKVLRAVGEHTIVKFWEAGLANQVIDRLTTMKVDWTSLDVVRIGIVGKSSAPVILWIGVTPESLSGENGRTVAFDARKVLYDNGIKDIEVEIRESRVFKSIGPKLLTPVLSSNPLVAVSDPLTVALGLPICADKRRNAGGTGGFYVARSGFGSKLFLVTARHVIFPPSLADNGMIDYRNPSHPQHKVILLSDAAYNNLDASIMREIGRKAMIAEYQEARRQAMQRRREDDDAEDERAEAERLRDAAKKAIDRLNTFHREVVSRWSNPAERILGHVVLAPPLEFGVGPLGFTQDIAVVEIDPSKINPSNFRGNVIDLGTEIDSVDFTVRMYPDVRNHTHFKYPTDRLLKLCGTISVDDMRRPQMIDQDGEKCIMVLKNGSKTGRTIGRANNVFSYTRRYFANGPGSISKEWAILPADSRSGPFSALGDSGSVIVDGRGRIGGLLTGGAGATETSDITYATPVSFVLERLEAFGFKVNFNLPPAA